MGQDAAAISFLTTQVELRQNREPRKPGERLVKLNDNNEIIKKLILFLLHSEKNTLNELLLGLLIREGPVSCLISYRSKVFLVGRPTITFYLFILIYFISSAIIMPLIL